MGSFCIFSSPLSYFQDRIDPERKGNKIYETVVNHTALIKPNAQIERTPETEPHHRRTSLKLSLEGIS